MLSKQLGAVVISSDKTQYSLDIYKCTNTQIRSLTTADAGENEKVKVETILRPLVREAFIKKKKYGKFHNW